ncbi:MAG: MBL fold metallo-hydrolase [Bacteriovoracales bacterium]|nr:MBL fold metallo-hydrolase [Bacteriovoracales bacterium]
MNIERLFTQNALRNYDYILTTSCGRTIVIDPSDPPLLERSLHKVDYYLITHEHGDHIAGLDRLPASFGGDIIGPKDLESIVSLDRVVKEGDHLFFEQEKIRVISIPGHIPSHIGFILYQGEKETAAFLGDTVFNGGVGNTRCGDSRILYKTIQEKVLNLSENIVFYPEHDYWETNLKFCLDIDPQNKKAAGLLALYQSGNYRDRGMFPAATIGEEKEYNLFFQTHLERVQSLIRKRCGLSKECCEEDIFVALRSLRDQW